MVKKEKNQVEWYNEPSAITNVILGLIIVIILLSQSFAIKNELSAASILSSILSHNSIYLLVSIYFIFLKTKVGKKYFNFLNIFLMLIYLLTSFTSLLTVLQSFTLGSIMSLCIHLFIVLYLVHTFFRGTRIWKDYKLSKSPFNEFTNDSYFYVIVILGVILLAVNLIMTTSFDGTILALLDCSFTILFARYVYLYWEYLDEKKIDVKKSGNFNKVVDKVDDEVKEKFDNVKDFINDTSDKLSDKLDDVIDAEKVSKAFNDATDKVTEIGSSVKKEVEEFINENKEIDEKFDKEVNKMKEKVVEFGKNVKEKVEELDIDDKKNKDNVGGDK